MKPLRPNTGFLHRQPTIAPYLWKGNFNGSDSAVNQDYATEIVINLKTMVMATLKKNDEVLIGPPDQLIPQTKRLPINKQGVLDTELFEQGDFKAPVLRSLRGEFAMFLYKNRNGTPYFYMVADEKQSFEEVLEARTQEVLAAMN